MVCPELNPRLLTILRFSAYFLGWKCVLARRLEVDSRRFFGKGKHRGTIIPTRSGACRLGGRAGMWLGCGRHPTQFPALKRQRSFNWQSIAFVMRGLWVQIPPLAFALAHCKKAMLEVTPREPADSGRLHACDFLSICSWMFLNHALFSAQKGREIGLDE